MGWQKKETPEMAQVASSASASPLWRTPLPNKRQDSSGSNDTSKVVGAAYSHADMLKYEPLTFSLGSRPQTPPSGPQSQSRKMNSSPLSKPNTNVQRTYPGLGTTIGRGNAEEDYDDDEDDEYAFDDDNEDEFGLPRITNVRKKGLRQIASKGHDPGGGGGGSLTTNGVLSIEGRMASTRIRANSSDIAEERGGLYESTVKAVDEKILRPQYKDILRDPANAIHLISHRKLASSATPKEVEAHSSSITRINKFKRILQATSISLSELRDLSWNGIPEQLRAMSWQLLLGYLPTSSERRVATLERKRKEYMDSVRQAFERGTSVTHGVTNREGGKTSSELGRGRGLDEAIWHQISIDVPRTNPHLELYGYEATQRSLERILYVWAIRHPASGYVQGINDLVTPFWQVFLGSYITNSDIEFGMDPGQLPKPVLDAVEADSFWCLTKLLDGIQDNYIFAQPGIQRQVGALRDLTMRIDSGLAKHIENEGVEFIQFSFRWMNCLLMREVSVKNTIRMWDTYMAEEQGFSEFHIYVCAAFLVKWSEQLVKMDFQEILMFLQALPTRDWTEKDIELLLSEAFIWQSLFRGSRAHLRSSTGSGHAVV